MNSSNPNKNKNRIYEIKRLNEKKEINDENKGQKLKMNIYSSHKSQWKYCLAISKRKLLKLIYNIQSHCKFSKFEQTSAKPKVLSIYYSNR